MITGVELSASLSAQHSPQVREYADSCFFSARRVCKALKQSDQPLSAEEIRADIRRGYRHHPEPIEQRLFDRIIEVSISKQWLTKHRHEEYEWVFNVNPTEDWLKGEIDVFKRQFSAEEHRSLIMENKEYFFSARRVCQTLMQGEKRLSAGEIRAYMGDTYGRAHGRIEQRVFDRIIEVSISKNWLIKHSTEKYQSSSLLKTGEKWLTGDPDAFKRQFSDDEARSLIMGNIELQEGCHYNGHEFAEILENRRRWSIVIGSASSLSDSSPPEGSKETVDALGKAWKEVQRDIETGKAVYYSEALTDQVHGAEEMKAVVDPDSEKVMQRPTTSRVSFVGFIDKACWSFCSKKSVIHTQSDAAEMDDFLF